MERRDDSRDSAATVFSIEIAGGDVRFPCRADQSLLAAMMAAGHRALAVGCRSGGCGVCRVRILSGRFATGHMNRAVVTVADEQAGILLSCRTFPRSDIRLEPMPRATGTAQIMERAA
jgi:ferredoxin